MQLSQAKHLPSNTCHYIYDMNTVCFNERICCNAIAHVMILPRNTTSLYALSNIHTGCSVQMHTYDLLGQLPKSAINKECVAMVRVFDRVNYNKNPARIKHQSGRCYLFRLDATELDSLQSVTCHVPARPCQHQKRKEKEQNTTP